MRTEKRPFLSTPHFAFEWDKKKKLFTPFINLYAATKAFEHSYSRALNVELKPMGITVTTVSPRWVDTNMLAKEANGKKNKFHGIVSPNIVAKKR